MFYKNAKLKKKVSKAKLTFTNFDASMNTELDDAIMPFKTAKISYNFNIKNGSLKTGYGFKKICLPKYSTEGEREIISPSGEIKRIWFFKYYNATLSEFTNMLLIYSTGGDIYSCMIKDDAPFCSKILNSVYSNGIPNAINYRLNSKDSMIFSSETDGMWVYTPNHVTTQIQNAPHIKSMCIHYERLFAIVGGERNRLAFSANLDPTDWQEDLTSGGFIDMQDERGGLSAVISYNDYVYVFRDYGVARISAYGDQSDFSVTQLFKSSVKLYGNTVTLCGNKVLLLARDGIHIFDGYSTKKLNLGIDSLFNGVNNDGAYGLYYNNKFYLACRLNFNDGESIGCEAYNGGYINNALIEYDLNTNDVSITRGIDISSMLALDDENVSKLVATFNGEHSNKIGELTNDGKLFGMVLPKKWTSPKSSMGYFGKTKHLEESYIKTKTDCNVKIETDKHTKTFIVKGSNISKRVKLGAYGEQVQVSFSVNEDGDVCISCPEIIIGVSA